MEKYRLPYLKDHLVSCGLTITKLRQKAHAIVGDDDVSARTWASVLNEKGAGETSVNVIIDVAAKTLKSIDKPCPKEVLVKELVKPKCN